MLEILRGISELILPRHCVGCGQPGCDLCMRCREGLRRPPRPVQRPNDVGIPVFALGPYSEMRRNLIIGMKEKNNQPARPLLGAVLAAGLGYLQARGELPEAFDLVPAPTRPRSARRRGGDPVTHMCAAAATALGNGTRVRPLLRLRGAVADQTALGAGGRWANMAAAVEVMRPSFSTRPVVLIDDVVTTGATLAASARRLRGTGVAVAGALVLAEV